MRGLAKFFIAGMLSVVAPLLIMAADQPTLRIAYSDWPGWTAWEIADKKGFFHHTRYMHACRETFLAKLLATPGMDKRDQVNNLNFFMYVPLDAEGRLNFADGISSPGKYIELEAMMNVIVLVSNCPQLNNPCNGYDPTPVKMIIWDE